MMKITTLTHPLRETVSSQIETYILTHWTFTNSKQKQTFLSADISSLACRCFPYALEERINLAALLFSIIFLIDANLGDMDVNDGEDYLHHLQDTIKGYWDSDRSRPDEWIFCDLIADMQSFDYLLVGEIVNSTMERLRIRNSQRRSRINVSSHDDWLALRNTLFGDEVIGLLLRFVMGFGFDADLSCYGIKSSRSSPSLEESRGRKLRRRGESQSWHGGLVQDEQVCMV